MVSYIRRLRFGERLREERRRLEFSQTAFGGLVGVRKGAQHHYETGQRSPIADYLMSAAAHGVDVLYLLTGERAGEPSIPEIRPTEQAAELPAGREPASPRVPSPPECAGWRRISGAIPRFEASRAADVVGAGIVAFLVYVVFFVAGVLG